VERGGEVIKRTLEMLVLQVLQLGADARLGHHRADRAAIDRAAEREPGISCWSQQWRSTRRRARSIPIRSGRAHPQRLELDSALQFVGGTQRA
jgi:hypothetical protein